MKLRVFVVFIFAIGMSPSVTALVFQCLDGVEIPSYDYCNGVIDCPDGSDEIYANATEDCPKCGINQVMCPNPETNLSCIVDRGFICNNTFPCLNTSPCKLGCPQYYSCQGAQGCFARDKVCSEPPECYNQSPWSNGIGFKCIRNGKTCNLPQQLLFDNVQDCDDASDLCYKTNLTFPTSYNLQRYPGARFDTKLCFMCLDGSMIVPRHRVCDGKIDCSDLSDECLCERHRPDICDDVFMRFETRPSNCTTGQVSCGTDSHTCVNKTAICNGYVDCDNNVDERYSYCGGTLPCWRGLLQDAGTSCRCSNADISSTGVLNIVATMGILCNGVQECPLPPGFQFKYPPGFPQTECSSTCPNTDDYDCTNLTLASNVTYEYFICPVKTKGGQLVLTEFEMAYWCNGIVQCWDKSDEVNCPDRFNCTSGLLINIPKSDVCNGYVNCNNGEDETRSLCPHRYYCSSLNGTKVSIDKSRVCDFHINCDNAADEMNCSAVDGRWYCHYKTPLFVKKSEIMNGVNDCGDWSDECSPHLKSDTNVLSSRFELIGNPILRGLVWVMALLALVGNVAVIVDESKKLNASLNLRGSASMRTNQMLVLNLAVADLLMGVYLLMLGIVGIVYSGVFCSTSLQWLGSTTCVAMGILVVVSCETSVLTLMLLTISRLYAVYYPIKATYSPSALVILTLIIFTWVGPVILATMPLTDRFQNTFVDKAMVANNTFFGNTIVKFDSAKSLSLEMFSYLPELSKLNESDYDTLSQVTSWNELFSFIDNVAPVLKDYIQVIKYYGYYSASSVCIPKLFVTREHWSWQFSLTISVLNFVVFLFVSGAYGLIFYKAGTIIKHRVKENKLSEIQRRILRLIVTDFLCWVPLSIMVFINFSGVPIDSIVYTVSAIILLPINSALNPILYSSFFDRFVAKFRGNVRKMSIKSTASTSNVEGTVI